jgi:BirA family biotin operon repressor/biotin-[acetyl-CoA-carboxylase] ligase
VYKILANTLFLGKEIIYMPSCHSTNELARELANNPATREGTLVITDHQTKGKGQRGNVWESESGSNITMSLILKPTFVRAKDQFTLNMITSLAVSQALQDLPFEKPVSVKWPNDVLLNEKKVCGILIENALTGNFITSSIVGIGLNVNQKRVAFTKATSMAIEYEVEFEIQALIEAIVTRLEQSYLVLKSGDVDLIKSRYLQNLFGFNRFRNYKSEYVFEGQITNVDENGRLVIKTDRGMKVFDFKEVEFLY